LPDVAIGVLVPLFRRLCFTRA